MGWNPTWAERPQWDSTSLNPYGCTLNGIQRGIISIKGKFRKAVLSRLWEARAASMGGVANEMSVEEFCPAKVNLFLAVTGQREDGYHDLVSLMVPVGVGDVLRMRSRPEPGVRFRCDDPGVPTDGSNLVLRAVELFRTQHPFSLGLDIELKKRIPVGAGLGGGSSDGAGAILALNQLLGQPLSGEELHEIAALVGSDCPFFLKKEPVVVRGRGDVIDPLPGSARAWLRGQRLLLLRPAFPVATEWAYGAMARRGGDYLAAEEAEERLRRWIEGERNLAEFLFNNMEPAVFEKYVALAVLKKDLQKRLGLPVLMSGSGSTLFCLVHTAAEVAAATAIFREACGESGWVCEAVMG